LSSWVPGSKVPGHLEKVTRRGSVGHSVRVGNGNANDRLRAARLAQPSPTLPGEVMSRSELADAVNAHLWHATGRRFALDAHTIARYERGAVRWPNAAYRSGLRTVLGARSDAERGSRLRQSTG